MAGNGRKFRSMFQGRGFAVDRLKQ